MKLIKNSTVLLLGALAFNTGYTTESQESTTGKISLDDRGGN